MLHLRSDFTKLLSCGANRANPYILIMLIEQLQMKIRFQPKPILPFKIAHSSGGFCPPHKSFSTMCYFLDPFLCRPAYGGKFCEGSARSYKLCNTVDCPPNTTDYRAQQCAEFNSRQFRGWHYTWRPYTKVDGKPSLP